MKKIIVLDFLTQEVHTFDYDENKYDDIDYFLDDFNEQFDLGIKASNCQFMVVDELKLNIH